ncbi:DUF2846 domain-containing protein [Marinobacterium sediminicola]|uniref:DUF2846 domain-containing protein n=1 Tax=Marinobacterium sediminicola TaxID=518898 RepID=A0ABY1S3X2_9GAMM|nr:DUF2846 domain-containing protein [Marinobacterium sediminicola]ULG70183.1 DUF2846 domain-containing protein [Marinobacterium sediminicola]SMR78347.1 Protein of unknown function [Marinobacterium sediminicola]
MSIRSVFAVISVLWVMLLGGCASVPMDSMSSDSESKQFIVPADKSSIYVYRNETFGGAIPMTVALNGRVAGQTGPKTYFHWVVDPGRHEISSITENTSTLVIDTQPGESYYIWQEVKMGLWMARSLLQQVDTPTGQAGVLECKKAHSNL